MALGSINPSGRRLAPALLRANGAVMPEVLPCSAADQYYCRSFISDEFFRFISAAAAALCILRLGLGRAFYL